MSVDYQHNILRKADAECAVLLKIANLPILSSRIRIALETFDVVIINAIDMIPAPGDNLKKDRGAIIRGLFAKSIRLVREGKTLIVTSSIKETATIESVDSVIYC